MMRRKIGRERLRDNKSGLSWGREEEWTRRGESGNIKQIEWGLD